MTVDLSEGETESKPRIPCASGFKVETCVGPRDLDLLKNGHWKDAKEAGDGDSGNYSRGTADLTTGFKDSMAGRVRVPDPRASGQGKMQGGRLRSSESRKVPVLSSEGDGDEETEDDFDEGNGPVAAAVSEAQNEQQNEQEQSREHLHKPERKEPQEQVLPAAQPPVGWESFLPQRNVKVLLAEDDDSTRQVVGALLRNCSYEVSSVANGMQAWEMLQDPSNQFDLVLTDVVMPCLSGVGLLTKITSNESGKRIPVIMMSSHDSLDIVFRCLSKGAADFLVKPVRKNELKNLWQHVWRCQSSSGSGGSGSGSGNGKGTRAKSRVGSGNNTGSNDGSDDNSSGLNVRGGSDNGSGTQAVVHPLNKQKRDKPDVEEGQATSLQKLSNHQMGQDLEMATRRPTPLDIEKCDKAGKQDSAKVMQEDSPSTSGNSGNKLEKDSGGALSGGSSAKAIDLIGGISFRNNEDVDEGVESGEGSARGASNSPANDKCGTSSSLPPLLELSLKRPRAPGEDGNNEKRALRHSGGSAFSRYGTNGTTIQQTPIRNPLYFAGYPAGGPYGTHALSPATGPLGMGNGVQGHLSSPIDRVGSSKGMGEGSSPKPMHPRMSQKGNGQDMGSSTVGSSTPEGFPQQPKDEVVSVSPMSGKSHPLSLPLPPRGMIYDNMSAAYGPALHQVFYTHSGAPPWACGTAHFSERGEVFDCPPYQNHGSHTAHHASQHHQQHPRHSRVPQLSVHPQQEDQVVTNQASGAPRCGSSTMAGSVPDGNAGQSGSSNGYGSAGNCNGSVNGSGSGSNNMNNQNGQSCVALNATQNADCAGNNGNGFGAVTGGFGHEQNRFARREAALNKFRQKRKERCFEKKVRYQSRKRLAEQRPRVRGQFVRQAVYDPNAVNDMAD